MQKFIQTILFYFVIILVQGQEKIVVDIAVEGCKRTKVSFIEKLIKLKKGSKLDSTILNNDIENLNRLINVANADWKINYKNDNECIVTYLIEENFTLIPTINFWMADSLLSCHFGLKEFNLFGKGMVLGAFYRHNVYGSYGINFTAPFLFSKNTGISLSFKDWNSKEPLFFNNKMANYRYGNLSAEILGLYRFNFQNKIDFGINIFKEKYKFLDGANPENHPEIPSQVNMNKYMLKGIYEYNNLLYFFYLIEGIKSTFNLQYVRTKDYSHQNFFIAWNDFIYFKRIKEKGNFATRFRFGLASNHKSPFAPFTLDNLINIRGVGNIVDRGSGTLVWNLEYRYTFYEKKWFVLQGNAFTDLGSWRKPGGPMRDFIKEENIKIHPGIGIRFIHKTIYNAIFRIDYGFGVDKDRKSGIVFGVKQYF